MAMYDPPLSRKRRSWPASQERAFDLPSKGAKNRQLAVIVMIFLTVPSQEAET